MTDIKVIIPAFNEANSLLDHSISCLQRVVHDEVFVGDYPLFELLIL